MSQPRAIADDTSLETFSTTSLCLEEHNFHLIIRGSRRDILQALTKFPELHSLYADCTLWQGILESVLSLAISREDKQKDLCIMITLDSDIDCCKDTVRCTSYNFYCWLLRYRFQSCR